MDVLDLFSGIGGFSLGLERAGMRTVGFCEIDPYCQRVLRKHWPDVPVFGDVRKLTAEGLFAADAMRLGCQPRPCGDLEHEPVQSAQHRAGQGQDARWVEDKSRECQALGIDVICGGFPCQDISVAGKGAGIEGERSGLWSEYRRVIGEVRPRYVIVENVAALLGRGLDRVLGDLAALGYDAEWHCIPASAVGAPHRRDRVWIVGHAKREGPQGCFRPGDLELQGEAQPPRPIRTAGFSFANGKPSQRLTISWGECSQWLTEPDVGRSLDGFPQWLDRCVGRGLSYAESCRRTEVLRHLWNAHVSKALRWASGGLERLSQAEILFAFVREYENGTDEARLLVEGKEASEIFLRGLRLRAEIGSAPRRSGQNEQFTGKHPDSLQPLSRFLAYDGEAYWAGSGWEDATPRVANGAPKRVDRLRTLGNAIVPQIAEIIGRAIMAHGRADRQTDRRL